MNTLNGAMVFMVAFALLAGHATETVLKPGMDKEREAMVAKWKKTLADGDQAAIENVLDEADRTSGVAFGMSDWPQAVAEVASKTQGPSRDLLLSHLRRHRGLINTTTSDWIRILFKRDVLDPFGEKVKAWAKGGEQGVTDSGTALKAADEAKRLEELTGLLEAMARCGSERFLPVAATYLSHENEEVGHAALGVFKAQAKGLEPDLRSPMRCQIWWLQTGRGLTEGK